MGKVAPCLSLKVAIACIDERNLSETPTVLPSLKYMLLKLEGSLLNSGKDYAEVVAP